MSKTTKIPEKADRALEKARGTVDRAVSALDRCVTRVADTLDAADDYDPKLASHLAYLTEHATSVLDGLRKLEKHDKDAVKAMTVDERDDLLKAHIATMPIDRRKALRAWLDDLDSSGVRP